MAQITKVYLLSVPLEKDYVHTLYFGSAADQYSYFRGNTVKTYEDFTYQRKDSVIRVPAHIDTLYSLGANYVMYQNTAYSNKWFYAFITDMKYVNDERTDITIQTDCIQTWMFDININPSFVEREHATTDEIGDHTLDEMLEIGELTVNKKFTINYGTDYVIVIAVTEDKDTANGTMTGGNLYGGLYSGVKYYGFDNTGVQASKFIQEYAAAAKADAITAVFVAPKYLASTMDSKFTSGEEIESSLYPYIVEINPLVNQEAGGVEKPYWESVMNEFSTQNIDGYVPKNKKLFCYPFRHLLVSNNAGSAAMYKFERFFTQSDSGVKTQLEPSFRISGVLTPGCSIRMEPQYYNGAEVNTEEGINMGKFPILNWTSDVYTNWLTQNSVNIGLQLAAGIGQTAIGIGTAVATGGAGAAIGGAGIAGGVSSIANTLAQIHTMSLTPAQSRGNINCGDVITADGKNTFQFYVMSVKAENARIIDEFFNMFGYKCQRVKIPAKAHRSSYWYTKTIDANITGAIPQDDLQTIKDCYNKGITFWRSATKFKNYSVSNGIV